MATREQRRAMLVPSLARLSRTQDFRTAFAKVTGRSHQQTIIVALPDDRVGYVCDRLREAGGIAALAMLDGEVCRIAFLWPASPARLAVAEEDDTLAQLHEESTVDLFFDLLLFRRTLVIESVAAQLADQCELQLA